MKKVILTVSCALMLLMAPFAAAQDAGPGDRSGPGSGRGHGQASTSPAESVQKTQAIQKQLAETEALLKKLQEAQNPRFVRTLTNVQIELTLTDQTGSGAPDKKVVSMIASSGNWGKVRSGGTMFPVGDKPYGVQLNVDARPFVSVDGPIQLEITLEYMPIQGDGDPRVGPKQRPSGINQSQTVVMQSGKPLVISQAADPISDRKVVVEVKATILK
jgi:hypothetical protein